MFKPTSFSAKIYRKYLNAAQHPSKVRIQNLLGKLLFRRGLNIIDEEGVQFKLMANDWITRHILEHGAYETVSIKLACSLLNEGGVFLDVGANFGLYSCILSANKKVSVYAVEPNYMILPSLLENIHLNNRQNIKVLNVALSNNLQFVGFDLPSASNLGTASFSVITENTFSMLSCTLEFIFESQNLKQVELLKIDIEGNEISVIKDFPFEKYCIKNILMEYNNLSNINLKELNYFFEKRGYIVKNILGRKLDTFLEDIPDNNLWIVNTK